MLGGEHSVLVSSCFSITENIVLSVPNVPAFVVVFRILSR
jgi:hypothetical protein